MLNEISSSSNDDSEPLKQRYLSMNEYNWISLSEHGNIQQIIKECITNNEVLEIVESLYQLQNQFFNIINK